MTGNSDPPNNNSKFTDTGGGVSVAKTVNSTPDCKQHCLNIHSLAFDHWLFYHSLLCMVSENLRTAMVTLLVMGGCSRSERRRCGSPPDSRCKAPDGS